MTNIPQTPYHVVRSRFYFNLPREFYLTLNGIWNSGNDNAYPFNYEKQKYSLEMDNISKETDTPDMQLDFMLEKTFLQKKLSAYVWGQNILTAQTIDAFYWFVQAYPHTINRTFGLGIRYSM
jgi:hypothetical protein